MSPNRQENLAVKAEERKYIMLDTAELISNKVAQVPIQRSGLRGRIGFLSAEPSGLVVTALLRGT